MLRGRRGGGGGGGEGGVGIGEQHGLQRGVVVFDEMPRFGLGVGGSELAARHWKCAHGAAEMGNCKIGTAA